ncbi:hypothetical protein F5876DRAFT_70917 [Lentinula aff. lateritia]|uniref:Uncharacterized protein n=1 Tax=Lentinula aff. lateritia TaxID=2804960 RepID=A0ACC1THD4_9AGAR|nr:hypothetical protein F5876DRAFT_70917 [Lentinula aff. lateritia]
MLNWTPDTVQRKTLILGQSAFWVYDVISILVGRFVALSTNITVHTHVCAESLESSSSSFSGRSFSGAAVSNHLSDPCVPHLPMQLPQGAVVLHREYKLSTKTTLKTVYMYPIDTLVEYPMTGKYSGEAVGHLFAMNVKSWYNPANNFTYSRGPPRGHYKGTREVLLLADKTGTMVPCTVRHSTCQGVKICPFYDVREEDFEHSSAAREQLETRLRHDCEVRAEFLSPNRDLFEHTSVFITALRRSGCSANVEGFRADHLEDFDTMYVRRGYPQKRDHCDGKIVFGYTFNGDPYIKCEHYSHQGRDHLFDGTIGNGSYHLEYLEAVITNDKDEMEWIETEVQMLGYGPKTTCHTVMNYSSQRPVCPFNHRDQDDGLLKQPRMEATGCSCIFQEYEPVEEFHSLCPYILIISKGVHRHPIPLPEKTPMSIKTKLSSLIKTLDADMADITPRQFLRHPIVKSYLTTRFPLLRNPMLSDLHVSLSNRSHLKVYIDAMKRTCFPSGTGWRGLQDLKRHQDSILPPEDQYIRRLVEIPVASLESDPDDALEDIPDQNNALRIVICMTPEASARFIKAQHLQSDIAFKRVIGYYEFEAASVDPDCNTSITYCRVFMTRQTAFAHHLVLKELNEILRVDTGRTLRWRHIHGESIDDYDGHILNWVVDQHGGQAKGLGIGLYLQDVAQSLPIKSDFHQPLQTIQDLGPYDHLRSRNIRKCAVTDEVRNLMRSLVCIRHDDWDGTIRLINELGGRPGQNWTADKTRAQFAFLGICWEKSYIPLEIWNASEIVHADVNREGIRCTLVGGVQKGQHYDQMKLAALKNRESMGIRDSYKTKNLFENATKNLKRRSGNRNKKLLSEDHKISDHNRRIQACWNKLKDAKQNIDVKFRAAYPLGDLQHPLSERAETLYQKACEQEQKAALAFSKQATFGRTLVSMGSGKVDILLPN